MENVKEFIDNKQKQYAKGIGNGNKSSDQLEIERMIEFTILHITEFADKLLYKAKTESTQDLIKSEYDNYLDKIK